MTGVEITKIPVTTLVVIFLLTTRRSRCCYLIVSWVSLWYLLKDPGTLTLWVSTVQYSTVYFLCCWTSQRRARVNCWWITLLKSFLENLVCKLSGWESIFYWGRRKAPSWSIFECGWLTYSLRNLFLYIWTGKILGNRMREVKSERIGRKTKRKNWNWNRCAQVM